jgi:hypothetical protein
MTDDTLDQDQLRELAARAAQLPREIEPPAEAWAAIKSAIETPLPVSRSRTAMAFWQRPAFLAAAALLLVAGSSAITAVALGGRNAVAADAEPEQVAAVSASIADTTPSSLAEFTLIENDYISSANRLAALLESDQMMLSEQTVAKLKESLRVIDAAILEARRALAADPANKQLMEMLSTSYNQKIDLLRRTTEMGRS